MILLKILESMQDIAAVFSDVTKPSSDTNKRKNKKHFSSWFEFQILEKGKYLFLNI